MEYHLEKTILPSEAIYTVSINAPGLALADFNQFVDDLKLFDSKERGVTALLKKDLVVLVIRYWSNLYHGFSKSDIAYIHSDFERIMKQYTNLLKMYPTFEN